jgi:hypothetical protein
MAERESTDDSVPTEEPSLSNSKAGAAIEDERRRLQKARAVLDCLTLGLNYEEFHTIEDVELADVATVARDLVSEAIDNLDTVVVERRSRGASQPEPQEDTGESGQPQAVIQLPDFNAPAEGI